MSAISCPPIGSRVFAGCDTVLAPGTFIRRSTSNQHWLLNRHDVHYHYLGRNASYALVKSLGLGKGGEILFPAFFGPPVLQAPIEAGATIRFYPVRTDLSVRIEDIEATLTPQTRAIYLIHYNGFAGPIQQVMELARRRNLIVIEDCAHALLTTLNGRPAGTFGDGAIFSFYKWVPVPNGAAFVANRALVRPVSGADRRSRTSGVALSTFSMLDYADRNWGKPGAVLHDSVRAFGKHVSRHSSLSYVSTGGVEFHYDQLHYAMSAISHRIMSVQRWNEIAARRQHNYHLLADLLGDIAPPVQGELPAGTTPLFYATAVDNKRALLSRLAARGIEGRNFWEQNHSSLPAGIYPETDYLRRTTMELPIHQDLDDSDIERIAIAMRTLIGTKATVAVPDRMAS